MDIAVATPLRLSKVAKRTDLKSVRFLILDEADKLFEEGLYKQTDRVIKGCSHPRLVSCMRQQSCTWDTAGSSCMSLLQITAL